MSYAPLLAEQVPQFLEKPGVAVVDMRDARSYEQDHLPGARLASDAAIMRLIKEKQPDRPLLVYCYHGNSSRDLCKLLSGFGFTQVYNLEGGWQSWAGHRDRLEASLSVPATVWLGGFGFDTGNLNSRIDNGMSALMVAAKETRADILAELLAAGADLTRQTLDGFTALDSASTLPVLRFLKPRYAAVSASVA
jgi:rhodanese-related sulfurtransferase